MILCPQCSLLKRTEKVKVMIATSVGSCCDVIFNYETCWKISTLTWAWEDRARWGRKWESRWGADLERGALTGCWPHGERVTPERLVREMRVGTSANSSWWATNSWEGRGWAPEVPKPGDGPARCPHNGCTSAVTCTLWVLPSAGLESPSSTARLRKWSWICYKSRQALKSNVADQGGNNLSLEDFFF